VLVLIDLKAFRNLFGWII